MTRLTHSEIAEAARAIHTRGEPGNQRGSAAIIHAKELAENVATIETDGTVALTPRQRIYIQGQLAQAANSHKGQAKFNISRVVVNFSTSVVTGNVQATINWSGRGEPEGTGIAPTWQGAFTQALSESIAAKIVAAAAKRELADNRVTAKRRKDIALDPEASVSFISPPSTILPPAEEIKARWDAGLPVEALTAAHVVTRRPGRRRSAVTTAPSPESSGG